LTIILAFALLEYLKFYFGFAITCLLLIYEIATLFRFVDKTNIELSRFLTAVKYSDTSQTFISKNFGKSFDELFSVFRNLTNNLSETRSEQEVGDLYLQTIIKHIAIGLITYRKNGEVELMNNAARKLLNVQSLKNINNLESSNRELHKILSTIKAGDKSLVRIDNNGESKILSIFAAGFKLKEREFTLVSLQDIKNELERERLSNELEIAHQVQMRLLPDDIPIVKGYAIAALCEPAKEVGGDYYDFIKIGEDKIGLVIGDVTGKGLPAAIYMTLVKGIFQSYAENNSSPADVLKKINKLVYQIIQNGVFVTMLYGILDIKNNKFTFSRAGHELPLIYKASEKKAYSDKTVGMALGFEKGDVFSSSIEEITINLDKGDTVLLYTDGVTEANNKFNEEYGKERIQDFVEENGSQNSARLLELFHEDVKNFCLGTEQFDDMTIVVIQRNNLT
jgi:serine phosphatase RsbU (regulator of sigma subunit)